MILVRSALFNAVFFALTFILVWPAALTALVSAEGLLGIVRLWARLLVGAARAICGIRLHVTGREHIPDGAALIASGHQSAFDTFVWFTLVPDCCYVLKQELTKIPVFGPLIHVARQIPIDRDAGPAAIRALLRAGTEALRAGRQVILFPEGTRSEPGTVGALQPGIAALAARSGQAVIPVATDSGRCWSRKAFVKRPGTITIAIGAPIPASLPREAMLDALRAHFASLEAPALQRTAEGAPKGATEGPTKGAAAAPERGLSA
ncbi:MAG TPA: lysophospholipid acyltransferase family protein [Rhodopila sp.]|uniref:lysophospholipid acyltransferase family protein n=1 Tax=Rhodopila sp. TaxID=2480087 RepID=UPI002CF8106A|nr:lysophospholipid acyltransferase family protein [Rhodopila sp.]HVY17216.1 lysophospholipid acyltransferase family protein [Rhodopila sp.]